MNIKHISVFTLGLFLCQIPVFGKSTHHYFNSRQLPINHNTTDDASKKILDVELWITDNNGNTWTLYDKFPKGKSQMIVIVPSDGTYGFKSVATDTAKNVGLRPTRGTMPDTTVTVDELTPAVQFLSQFPEVIKTGKFFDIEWVADDENLEIDGITIDLYDEEGMLLQNIAQRSQNTGKYRWNVTDDLADQKCFLRISATDKAKNTESIDSYFIMFKKSTEPAKTRRPTRIEHETTAAGPDLTNNRVFDIHYHIQSAGPSGLGNVKLWYTLNSGANWHPYGMDSDLTSPIQFKANQEGRYGFAIELINRAGSSSGQPVSGTKPAFETTVDFSSPSVLVDSPKKGSFYKGGDNLTIKWLAADTFLSKKPINIFYSSDSGNQWTAIAKGIENSGQYKWTVPQESGSNYQIKIEALDIAGNIGTAVSGGNFIIDSTIPNGSINQVSARSSASLDLDQSNQATSNALSNPASISKSISPQSLGNSYLSKDRDFKLANIYRTRGDYNKALEHYAVLAKKYPQNQTLWHDIAYTYYKANRFSKSIAIFNILAEQFPKNSVYQRQLGIIHFNRKRTAIAEKHFRDAIKLNSGDETAYWYLAKIYIQSELIDEARFCWQRIVHLDKPNSLLAFNAKKLLEKTKPSE